VAEGSTKGSGAEGGGNGGGGGGSRGGEERGRASRGDGASGDGGGESVSGGGRGAGARPGSKDIFVTSRVGRNKNYYKLNASAYPVTPVVAAKFKEMQDKGFFAKHDVVKLVRYVCGRHPSLCLPSPKCLL
jgi:hypothetical protein